MEFFNISQEEYDTIPSKNILFHIQFNQTDDYIRYNLSYNSTLYDQINFIKNDTYEFFTFIQKYRNPLGPYMTIYINNAIMKYFNQSEIQIEMQMYPNKQFTINDTSTVDHAVLQLCMSIFCICCCVYICKDRGIKSDQYALRLLGNSELCYQFVRLCSSLIVMLLSGCCLGIAAKFSNCVPFDKLGVPSSIIIGICLTLPLCPMILLISTLFGSNGAINPIIIMLIISLGTNFVTEIAFYLCLGAKNYKDYSVVPKALYYILIFLPNVNAINILDLAKVNTQNLDTQRSSLQQTLHESDKILCNKQSSIMSLKYYQIDNFSLLIIYNLMSSIIYFLLSLYIGYQKPESYYPGVNPFKLIFQRNRNQQNNNELEMNNVCITYKTWRKKIQAVKNLNISFNQIKLDQNIDQIHLGLLGCSGSGKSSTMGVLTGQIKPTGQQCFLLGYDLTDKTQLYKIRQLISYCPQLNENIIQSLTMKQNIKFAQYVGSSINQSDEYINQQLIDLDLPTKDLQINKLSGGMLRRLSLINSLIQQKQFYVFDEITSGIDNYNAELIDKKIQQLNCHYILSTHDMYEVEKLCNYVIIMKYGETKLKGSVEQIKFNNQITSIQIKINIDDPTRQTVQQIFQNADSQLMINSPSTLQYQLNDNNQLQDIVEQLQLYNIQDFTINRSNLNDIFIKYASIEEEQDNNIQQQIERPQIQSNRKIYGSLKLFQINDLRNQVLHLPPSILFLIVIIVGQIIAYLIYTFCKDYTDYLYDTYIQAYILNQGKECLSCCGIDQNTEFNNIQDIYNSIQQCNPQCYSYQYNSPYMSGNCLTFAMLEGLPVINPPEKIYYGYNIYDSVNTGFYNSQEKRIFIDFQQNKQFQQQFPNYQKLNCYTCQAICQAKCFSEQCSQQCENILKTNNNIDLNCSGSCMNIENTTYPYNQFISNNQYNDYNYAYYAQKEKPQLNNTLINDKNKHQIINEEVQDWVPLSIIKNISANNQLKYQLTSYYPGIRGGISIYGDFKIQIQCQDLNDSILQQNQNPYDINFWNISDAAITTYNKTYCARDCIYPCEYTTELADSNGVSLTSYPLDMYSYEITQIFNQIITQQNQNKKYGTTQNFEIQYTSKPQPFVPQFHESTTFTTYLAIVQCLIISILFEIPMIMSAITFTELKTTKIFSLLQLHGLKKFHIILGYLLFQSIIIISASILTLIISLLLNNQQANDHPILFCLYTMQISFSSLAFGILISLISDDKRKSALIASIFILLSMFLTIFLTHNSFLICFIPQLFSMWRLQYLSHTTSYEWLNVFVPLTETVIILILLFQLYDRKNNEKLHTITQDSIFEYNDHAIQLDYKLTHLRDQYSQDNDLILQNISLNIGHKEILHNISFNIQKQQIFALLGLSGSGKSVTLKTLTRQLQQNQGDIIFNQNGRLQKINDLNTNIISYVPQTDILPLNYKLYDIYNIFKLIHGHKNYTFIKQTETALNLDEHRNKFCCQLSGGQKRRLSILIALLQADTNIMAFDEVTTGQSPDLKQIILNLISQCNINFGKTCIITTHYLDEVINTAKQFVLINDGRIQIQNDINKIIQQQDIKIQIQHDQVSKVHSEKEKYIFAEGNVITFQNKDWNQVINYLNDYNIQNWITIDNNPSNNFLQIYKGLKISQQ